MESEFICVDALLTHSPFIPLDMHTVLQATVHISVKNLEFDGTLPSPLMIAQKAARDIMQDNTVSQKLL